ncbi:MAG: hypothetical protein SFU85_12875 [Candidatus Methylacidiphilales bacterium]|nr:hypothetical protein [Candidatus Methylacidiphilales bacterium]
MANAELIEKRSGLGEFRVPGEYYKDFFLLKDGETYHLFYNVGKADDCSQQWHLPGNEKCFGHATSTDLRSWEIHPRILPVVPATWESQVVSAPCVFRHANQWQMLYTGFDDQLTEWLGLASSADLFQWQRHEENPVYSGPSWTAWREGVWADCRDPHVIHHDGVFLMYTCVLHGNGRGAVALARSHDLLEWEDLGAVLQTDPVPESPNVFEHSCKWYLITSAGGAGAFMANSPYGPWEPIPMQLPVDWYAWEILHETHTGKEGYVIGAFYWQLNGNFIRFWELDFEGYLPVIRDRYPAQ